MSEEKQYPSLVEQGKNLAGFSFELVKQAIRGGALVVSDKVQNERMEICKSCEKYDESENRCMQCGCWLEPKTKFALDSCPLGKWKETDEDWMNGKYEELLENINKTGCCDQEPIDK